MKPHVHAKVIKAWADGHRIEFRDDPNDPWEYTDCPEWHEATEYRVQPEREYPKSSLSYSELCKVVNAAMEYGKTTNEGNETIIARFAADAAVKKYIQENEE